MPRTAGASATVDPAEKQRRDALMKTGLAALQRHDDEAQIIWRVKGPKALSGSEIQAVIYNGSILHILQRTSGRYTLFTDVKLEDLAGSEQNGD